VGAIVSCDGSTCEVVGVKDGKLKLRDDDGALFWAAADEVQALRRTKAAIVSCPDRRPESLPIKHADIPEELREARQWVCWRWKWREDGGDKQGGRWTKVPIDPKSGRFAKTTDPATWGTFERAMAGSKREEVDGVGFVFTEGDPFAGVDLDECRDPATGDIDSWAAEIVKELCSYTEVSPTGTGVKVILRGQVPEGGNRKGGVEMYDRSRFFAVTGCRVTGTPAKVLRRPKALRCLHARLFSAAVDHPPTSTPPTARKSGLSDDEIIGLAKAARNGDKFSRLWAGDTSGYSSPSEADLALCALTAFWTRDPQQLDRLFCKSGLYRADKWGRQDYRERTMANALTLTGNNYYRGNGPPGSCPQGRPAREPYRFAPLTTGEFARTVRRPTWLVQGLLVRDQPAVLGGPRKALKTSVAVDLAVSLATAMPFLGRFQVYEPARVVLLSGESGDWTLLETIKRVRAARPDPFGSKPGDLVPGRRLRLATRLPQLGVSEELEALGAGLREHAVEVLIIDPLYMALLAGTNLQASNLYDMGPLLYRVARNCLDAGATPVLVHHTRKGLPTGGPADLDDLAYAGVAEFARQWLLINPRQKFDPGTGAHRLWLSAGAAAGNRGGGPWTWPKGCWVTTSAAASGT
jgi:hypothetical protein